MKSSQITAGEESVVESDSNAYLGYVYNHQVPWAMFDCLSGKQGKCSATVTFPVGARSKHLGVYLRARYAQCTCAAVGDSLILL